MGINFRYWFVILTVLMMSTIGLGDNAKASVVTLEGDTTGLVVPGLAFTGFNDAQWTTDGSGNAIVKLGTMTWDKVTYINHVPNALVINISFEDIVSSPVMLSYGANVYGYKMNVFGMVRYYGDVFFSNTGLTHVEYASSLGVGSFDFGLYYNPDTSYVGGNSRLYGGQIYYSITGGSNDIYGRIVNASFTPYPDPVDAPIANPEPGTMLLMGIGVVGASLMRRRKAMPR